MNIENHVYNSKTCLDLGQASIESHDYDTALAMLAKAYSNVRELMDHVYELKCSASAAERPAGETVGGPEQ